MSVWKNEGKGPTVGFVLVIFQLLWLKKMTKAPYRRVYLVHGSRAIRVFYSGKHDSKQEACWLKQKWSAHILNHKCKAEITENGSSI